jgi:hypothetical protein
MSDPLPATPTAAAATGTLLGRLGNLGGRTLAILAALALVVAAADRSRLMVDWSADHRFSLSPSLVAILQQQQEPTELVSIWPQEVDDDAQPLADGLRLMAAANPRLGYRHIDPVLHKPLLAEFARRHHEADAPAIYVVRNAGERAFKIPVNGGTRRVLQREIAGALLSLADPHPPEVALLQGHGELRPDGGAEDGADQLVRGLELAGLRVVPVELARAGRIPADAVLVIAGPLAPLGGDLKAVQAHLADGGAALILGDDRMPLDLAEALRARGILLGPALPQGMGEALASGDLLPRLKPGAANLPPRIAASLRRHFIGQETAFPHHNLLLDGSLINPRHAATAALAAGGRSVLSPWTTPVQTLQPNQFEAAIGKRLAEAYAALGTPPFAADPLLQTAPGDAWLKQRDEPLSAPDPKSPPLPLAQAVESTPTATSVRDGQGARLVVWGSRQAASDGVLGLRTFANAELLTGLVRWLARREQPSAIPAAETAAFRVDASDTVLLWLAAILIAIIPCACIGAAIIAWWERR